MKIMAMPSEPRSNGVGCAGLASAAATGTHIPATTTATSPMNLTKVSSFCVVFPARAPSKLMPVSTTTDPTA